jgi:RNA polymerase sigma factor, sigma-70 family
MIEQRLVEQCRKGDNAARAELYKAYSPRLMAVCCRYASGREQAEDWLHDAFLRIFGQINRFRWQGEGSLKVWMEQVTRNVAIDSLRKRQTLTVVPLDEMGTEPTDVPEPTADDINRISDDELFRLIGELPEGYRVVFNLYCIDGCSHREIARLLGIKERTSASQLARAKALLAARVRQWIMDNGQ